MRGRLTVAPPSLVRSRSMSIRYLLTRKRLLEWRRAAWGSAGLNGALDICDLLAGTRVRVIMTRYHILPPNLERIRERA
jgi:hypothetical protein